MNVLVAFMHHIAAFSLVSALAVEFVLIRDKLTLANCRKLQVVDLVYGLSAVLIIIVGLLRVFYFEKGTAYYFASLPFIIKMIFLALVGIASIYPTVVFLSWGKHTRQGLLPSVSDKQLSVLKSIIIFELLGIGVIILGAVMMAKGVWYI